MHLADLGAGPIDRLGDFLGGVASQIFSQGIAKDSTTRSTGPSCEPLRPLKHLVRNRNRRFHTQSITLCFARGNITPLKQWGLSLRPPSGRGLDLSFASSEYNCLMKNSEIIFAVQESPEGGFEARALGHSIFTQAESMEELREMVRDAVRCHFEADTIPAVIRLHFVHDEVIVA